MKTVATESMVTTAAAKQETAITSAGNKPKTLQDLVEMRKDQIAKVLPKVLNPEEFTRLTLNAIMTTKHLGECDMKTFYAAVMNCAQLGLKPNVNGEAYLLPYYNNKQGVYNCQFIPGYKGLMMLARRSGEIASIDAQTVYENDVFELSYGFEPALIHKPLLTGDRGAPKGFYAAVIMKDGGKNAYYMSVDDAKKYGKKYSKSFSDGPWQKDFEAMAKKSCLRQVLKYCPCSSDVDRAIEVEDKYDNTSVDVSFFDPDMEIEQAEIVEPAADELNVNEDGEVVEE